ncbi:MAG: SAM-dependent methyltransferase [Acidimicrobiales bacterium]|jgi:tRNA (cmo5U34)-methyltransferase|nr:SAM-dependent methyltransferase [Acidimicrobiales bacterium]
MTATSGAWFDRWVDSYDAGRRQLIPCFDAFYGAAAEVAALGRSGAVRVLDLGAGTGILSAAVAAALPDAELVLLDEAPAMLERAAQRLAADGRDVTVVVGDLADALPAGPFGAIVSALAIHHLSHPAKRDLFARVLDRLEPGGVFVNAEQVAGPTPSLDARYAERWIEHTRALGTTDAEHAEAAERMAIDLPAPVEDQVAWLRDAGFVDADCVFKAWRFAVYAGWRPPAPPA